MSGTPLEQAAPPERRRPRGGRRRALAPHLRRHDHAADGAVHRPVGDLVGEHLEVRRAQGVAHAGLLGQGPARATRRAQRRPGAAEPGRAQVQSFNADPSTSFRSRAREPAGAEQHRADAPRPDRPERRAAGARQPQPHPGADRECARRRTASRQRSAPRSTSAGLVVRLLTDKVLFDVRPGRRSRRRRCRCSREIGSSSPGTRMTNPVRVEGNTDNVPISTAQFPSNWELSTARATAVLEVCSRHGVPPSACPSPATATRTRSPATRPPTGRSLNRRVDIVVLRNSTHAAGATAMKKKLKFIVPVPFSSACCSRPTRCCSRRSRRPQAEDRRARSCR